jgi:hypothetical protein
MLCKASSKGVENVSVESFPTCLLNANSTHAKFGASKSKVREMISAS